MKQKRGYIFILITTFLGIGLLTLAIILSSANTSYEQRLNEIASFERLNSIDSSIQNSLRQIFNETSGITILISDSKWNVTFNETLQNLHQSFNTTMEKFNTSIRNNYTFVNIDVERLKNTLPLEIVSHNIIYSHPKPNVINITMTDTPVLVNYYRIDVNSHSPLVISAPYPQIDSISTTPGQFLVEYNLRDFVNPLISKYLKQTIDTNFVNKVNISLNKTDNIYIEISPYGNMHIVSFPQESYKTVNVTIGLVNNYKLVDIRYPQGTLNIQINNSGIKKIGDVKIV